MTGKFSLNMPDFHVALRGIFYMPYIYDMGPTALLPFGRNGVLRIVFFLP
jgi:hypothetical protein